MKIDFKNEVLKRKKEFLSDLAKLIEINSELTTYNPKRKGMPFGEGPRKALDLMLDFGKRDGLEVLNVDGYAGHIDLGNQDEFVAVLGHLDVVPAGNDWTYPPYQLTLIDNKLYARGIEDDKGPTMAAYYAMKILKELDVKLSKKIRLILGTDEESGSRCLEHYFRKHPEQPVSGFVPDADFPLIYAEKGIVRFHIEGLTNNTIIKGVKAGFRANMVPDYADLVLAGNNVEELLAFDKDLTPIYDNNETKVRFYGKSAHGSTPEFGDNSVFKLVKALNSLKIESSLTNIINNYFVDDLIGEKLEIKTTCPETGKLSLNLGVLEQVNNTFKIILDIRYPKGITHLEILEKIETKVSNYDARVTRIDNNDMLYVDPNSKLVKTLMSVYQKHTGDYEAKPVVIGGGTYARAISNCVAFGPHFPGKPSFIHQKDEYVLLDDLLLATIIYLEALYELAK